MYGDDIPDDRLDGSLPFRSICRCGRWFNHGICYAVATIHVLTIRRAFTIGHVRVLAFWLEELGGPIVGVDRAAFAFLSHIITVGLHFRVGRKWPLHCSRDRQKSQAANLGKCGR